MILTSSGTIIAIVTALFAFDSRYAHAADVDKNTAEVREIVKDTFSDLRKQMLEDKLFELDVKRAQTTDQKLLPLDAALRARYQRQLDEIVQKSIRRP
jgi:hypothetical protein